jgi:hypothetical protein
VGLYSGTGATAKNIYDYMIDAMSVDFGGFAQLWGDAAEWGLRGARRRILGFPTISGDGGFMLRWREVTQNG